MTSSARPITAVFIVPVGPKDVERAAWTVRSIRNHCPDRHIRLLLDGPVAADLSAELSGDDIMISEARTPSRGHWGKIWLRQCEAMVDALALPGLTTDAVFVKIDADALVVRAGLAERARDIFATRPFAGQLGQCFSNVLGKRQGNRGWANFYRKMMGWRGLLRITQGVVREGEPWYRGFGAHRRFRELVTTARKKGYTDGEFAIGGSYLLRREVVEKLAPLLADCPFRYLPTTGEDGVMTPYVYATGFSAFDDISDGGLFAVEGRAFRVDPFVLRARGHYILHPTKYGLDTHGHQLTEAALVERLLESQPEA